MYRGAKVEFVDDCSFSRFVLASCHGLVLPFPSINLSSCCDTSVALLCFFIYFISLSVTSLFSLSLHLFLLSIPRLTSNLRSLTLDQPLSSISQLALPAGFPSLLHLFWNHFPVFLCFLSSRLEVESLYPNLCVYRAFHDLDQSIEQSRKEKPKLKPFFLSPYERK
jgi:hypothetical protein